jgi:uncharacterized linocin/CFP29 family protein
MMHSDLVEACWTEDHWNRITAVVTEEAQRARVAAQLLPVVGPLDPSTVAVPNFTLNSPPQPKTGRLRVNSDPNLYITTIAINVYLKTVDVADPDLSAALIMFRRAANWIARIEDALIFSGPQVNAAGRPIGAGGIPRVYDLTGRRPTQGIFWPAVGPGRGRFMTKVAAKGNPGVNVVNAVVKAADQLDRRGQLGPFACVLGDDLFEIICTPTPNMVLPRDRILPFLAGPLIRSSAVARNWGALIATSGNPVELVVASDVSVRFLQTTLEPRFVFRVSERIALRVHEDAAIELIG